MKDKLIVQKKPSKSLSSLGETAQIESFEDSESLKLLSQLYSNSMPRNLTFSATMRETIHTHSRDTEYLVRHEMYEDTFTRECVKVIIARAIGTTHDNIKPFSITLKKDVNIGEKEREFITEELSSLVDIIDETLLEVVMDSQFFGDGFAKRVISTEKGVEKLLCNFSTKPINIVPIVTNKGTTVAYEVSPNIGLLQKPNAFSRQAHTSNGREYVSDVVVARLNSPSNGIHKLNSENFTQIDNMNVFSEKTMVYEDTIYGGVMEDCEESFNNYQWAIKALVNRRIASSVVERFITHSLSNVGEEDRNLLKKALENQIKSVQDNIKTRVDSKDPSLMVANHIIPTTGDGINTVSIQESSPDSSGLASAEDIMIHIKRYLADIGFDIELTPYGSGGVGGNERDGKTRNSIQMDVQGEQIRKGIRKYVLDTALVHFIAKFNKEIDISLLEVNFTSVVNQAKLMAEDQRLEALSNTQQLGSLIEQLKAMLLPENEDTKTMLEEMIEPLIPQTSKNKDIQVKAIIAIILTPPPKEEGF